MRGGPERDATRGSVPNGFVQVLYDYLASRGHDAEAVLGAKAPVASAETDGRFAMTEWRSLLERASEALGDPLLGLHVGDSLASRHGGMLSYLMTSCGTVGDAFERYARFERLFYDANLVRYGVEGEFAFVEWSEKRGRPGRLVDECAIAGFTRLVRAIASRDATPLEVSFENDPPEDVTPYEAYFGCPVRFAEPTTRLRWPSGLLGAELRSRDPALASLVEPRAEAMLAVRAATNELERDVRRVIAALLRGERTPSLEAVAKELGLGARTLRRRLDERGTSFRDVVDESRCRLAEAYLRDDSIALSDVAQRVGFSEQSAFQRSFKRWTGQTPRRWREQHAGKPSS